MKQRPIRASVSAVALFGALGVLPMAAQAEPALCNTASPPANAQPGETHSAVLGETSDLGMGVWQYQFRVCNLSISNGEGPLLVDWELPFFGTTAADLDGLDTAEENDAGWIVTGLPEGWFADVVHEDTLNNGADPDWKDPADPFHDERYLATDLVLHFFTDFDFEGGEFGRDLCEFCAEPGDAVDGLFTLTAGFAPTNAPYQASWVFNPPRSGDPDFPLDPNEGGGGGPNSPALQQTVPMPEPGSLALLGAGLGALGAVRRRKKSAQD